jgi:hypothetical protein
MTGPASQTTNAKALSVIAFQSPANIGHHKRFRHASGMGFEETSEGLDQTLVEVGCPSFFDERNRTCHEFWRQLGLNHRFFHGAKLSVLGLVPVVGI